MEDGDMLSITAGPGTLVNAHSLTNVTPPFKIRCAPAWTGPDWAGEPARQQAPDDKRGLSDGCFRVLGLLGFLLLVRSSARDDGSESFSRDGVREPEMMLELRDKPRHRPEGPGQKPTPVASLDPFAGPGPSEGQGAPLFSLSMSCLGLG
eukprot:998232-Prorocentrum_minimum.AAC.1